MRYMPSADKTTLEAGSSPASAPSEDDAFDVTSSIADAGPSEAPEPYKSPTIALLRGLGRIAWRHLDPSVANHHRGLAMLALMALLILPVCWLVHFVTLAMPSSLSAGLFGGVGLVLGVAFLHRAVRSGDEELFGKTHLALILAAILAGIGWAPGSLLLGAIGPMIVAYGIGAFVALVFTAPAIPAEKPLQSASEDA